MKFCCIGAHVYIVGIGVTALITLITQLNTTPSLRITSACFIQLEWTGASFWQIHTALLSNHLCCSVANSSVKY